PDVQYRILHQALRRDRRHLRSALKESANVDEGAAGLVVPEEIVPVRRQAVAMRAELVALFALAAIVGEEAPHDAVLDEPAERERDVARRPGELVGDGEVRGRHQRRAERDGQCGTLQPGPWEKFGAV